jgi:hypothetical protein
VSSTHPDLGPAQLEEARRELGFPRRDADRDPKAPKPPWRDRMQRTTRRALRPVYARLADAVAERIFVENPVGREVERLEAALTRVEAELELMRGQVVAQRDLLDRLGADQDPPHHSQ